MKKKVLFTTTAFTLAAAGFRYFSDMAVSRKFMPFPRLIQRRVDREQQDDIFRTVMKAAAEGIRDVPCQKLRLLAFDGLSLYGRVYEPERPKRVILFMHGWRSCWQKDFGILVRPLLSEDCLLFFADQRSHGESEGKYITYGDRESRDCRDWAKALASRYPELPIYLWGASMGATTVMNAAGEELPKSVAGIIADCGFTSAEGEMEHQVSQKLPLGTELLTAVYRRHFLRRCDFDITACSTVNALSQSTLPLLLFHGGSDDFVPLWMSEANYAAAKGEKELVVVDGAGHCKSFYMDFDTCFSKVKDFFARHDNGTL